MRARQKPSATEVIAALLRPFGRSARVLWVDLEPIGEGIRVCADALPEAEHEAAVVGPPTGDLGVLLRAVRARVRDGGLIAVWLPIEREGWRGVAQRALATFEARRKPRPLEEVCAALLAAHVSPVKVAHVRGARGEAVVHGTAVARS